MSAARSGLVQDGMIVQKGLIFMSIFAVIGTVAAVGAGLCGVIIVGTAAYISTTLLHSVEKKGSRFPR